MKPVIGINLSLRPEKEYLKEGLFLNLLYVRAVEEAGGIPFLLPVVEKNELIGEMIKKIDGLLMSGGDTGYRDYALGNKEIDSANASGYSIKNENKKVEKGSLIKGSLIDLYSQNPRRHKFDTALCKMALQEDMPVLGICRGQQTLNEVAGGSMVLDLAQVTGWNHRQEEPMDIPTHEISVEPDSMLEKMLERVPRKKGGMVMVNSHHRQAVNRAAPGFEVTARGTDGVVEAIESKTHSFVVGVQFHPEMMMFKEDGFGDIYRRLVTEASYYRKKVAVKNKRGDS